MLLSLLVSVMLVGFSVVFTSTTPHSVFLSTTTLAVVSRGFSYVSWLRCYLYITTTPHPLLPPPPHMLLSLVVLVTLAGYSAVSTSPPPLTLFFRHHHTCCCLSWFHSVPCPPLVCFQFFSLVPIVSDDDCIQKRLIVSQF